MAAIILIDDDDCLRIVAGAVLREAGHTVSEAANGREGLALFRHAGADLVITDIVMPETEGIGVVMELRKVQPPVKILAISGGGQQSAVEYLHIAKLLGAAKVLAKPFSNEDLIAAVDELLSAGEAPRPQPPGPTG